MHIKATALLPTINYSSAAGHEPRAFINENLTDHRRRRFIRQGKFKDNKSTHPEYMEFRRRN